jgi:tetratricopeptide (TPR) repeat protein
MPDFRLMFPGSAKELWLVVNLETGAVSGLPEILRDQNFRREAMGLHKALDSMGEQFERAKNYTAAVAVYEATVQIAAALGSRLGQGMCLVNLALAHKRAHRYDDAQIRYEEALALFQEPLPSPQEDAHRTLQLAVLLFNMANLNHERGDKDRVRKYATWAVCIVADSPDPTARSVMAECNKLLAMI